MINLQIYAQVIIAVLFILNYVEGISTNIYIYFLMIAMVICDLYVLLKYRLYSYFSWIGWLLIFIFSIYPLFHCYTPVPFKTITYCIFNFILIIYLSFTAILSGVYNLTRIHIRNIFIIVSLVLILFYLSHFDGFMGIKSFLNIFNKDLRYRNSYGFSHANNVATFTMLQLTLYLFYRKYFQEGFLKLLGKILVFFLLVLLISTGSRGSFITIIIISSIYGICTLSQRYRFKYSYIIYGLLGGGGALILSYIGLIYFKDNSDTLISLSNRGHNFEYNLPYFWGVNKHWFGLGGIQQGEMFRSSYKYQFIIFDNWYLYILFTLGIVGIILSCILIVSLLIYLIRYIYLKEYQLLLAITVGILFYSCFEVIFFINNHYLSFMYWFLILIIQQDYLHKDYSMETKLDKGGGATRL